jgi:hemolysin activation/secretion protein
MLKTALGAIALSLPLASMLMADAFKENEQRERQRDIFENLNKDPTKNIERLDTTLPSPAPISSDENETCFDTHNITLLGSTLITPYKIDNVISNYIGKCNSLSDLKRLSDELSALYIDKGYITSQVYLSPQNISEGNVTLMALEGKVKNITPRHADVLSAFSGQRENYLNIRDIEVALENINALPSNHATMKLIPSDETGYSDISVENVPTKRLGGSVGIDNFGGKATGRAQINARVNIDDIVGVNDQLNIFYNTSNKHYTEEDSIGNGFDYSFPISRATLRFTQRNSKFDQKVKSGTDTFFSRGRTKTYTFDTQYKIYHDEKHRVNAGMSISNSKTSNYFADIYLESSSYRLSKLALSVDYLYQIPGFYTNLNFSYTRGVDWFGNYHQTSLDDDYEFYNISLSGMKDFFIFRYSLNAYSQFAKDSLFGSDKISIGGPYSVRGFNKEGLSGNSGYYVRNELSYNVSYDILGGLYSSYFIALDGGYIRSDDDSFGGKLLSYSVGSKLQTEHLETSLHYAIPVHKKDVGGTASFFGVSLKAKF